MTNQPTILLEANLEECPYRVYYRHTVQLQNGGERTETCHHYGTGDLDMAKRSVLELRDYASRGKGMHYGSVIHSAWIDYLHRQHMEF